MINIITSSIILKILADCPDSTTREVARRCPQQYHTESAQARHVACKLYRLKEVGKVENTDERPTKWHLREESE